MAMVRTRFVVLGIGIALVAAACGTKAANTGSGSGSSGSATVDVRTVAGVGSVLTDAGGMSLYSPTQEANGTIMCTGACTQVWIPLKAPASGSPTAAPDVSGTVAVVHRPDGIDQVTLNGAPLYTFVQDTAAGQVNGNGASDNFGGTSFTWRVETSGGPAPISTSPSSGGHGY
jgi:predicted lipoprotein with Yx(FWY)xxD motif